MQGFSYQNFYIEIFISNFLVKTFFHFPDSFCIGIAGIDRINFY